jgi:carbonic anhydrase
MSVVAEVLAANERYAAGFGAAALPAPPRLHLAVLTCMDARLDPMRLLGLELGDAHVLRNAGALATDDALRSLAASHYLLGTREAIVVGHTECGIFGDASPELLGPAADAVELRPFPDVAAAVRASVETIRTTPLLPDSFGATGFLYDVGSGRLEAV